MDVESISSEVKAILDIELESKEQEIIAEETIQIILNTLQALQYQIVKVEAIADNYKLMDAQSVFEQWISTEDEEVEINIPVAQILQHLTSNGWIIIPPR